MIIDNLLVILLLSGKNHLDLYNRYRRLQGANSVFSDRFLCSFLLSNDDCEGDQNFGGSHGHGLEMHCSSCGGLITARRDDAQ